MSTITCAPTHVHTFTGIVISIWNVSRVLNFVHSTLILKQRLLEQNSLGQKSLGQKPLGQKSLRQEPLRDTYISL
jgi:hypothetical protein